MQTSRLPLASPRLATPHLATARLSPARLASACLAVACLAAAPQVSWAQVTVKNDGQWRALFTAGASVASGNSNSTTVNLSGEAVKATTSDKLTLNGRGLYVDNEETEAEKRLSAGLAYQRDLNDKVFGFGQLDALRDEPANLSVRGSVGGGLGYHLIRRDDLTFDVSAGVGYTQERYLNPELQDDGSYRTRRSNTEVLLAEESTHKFSETTTFRQKLSYLPDLRDSGEFRATFDTALSVAMTKRLSLTATVSHRYDSNPGPGLKKGDTLFITGVSFRID